MNDTPMLSVPEISRRLRVKPEKVRGWVVRGELIGVNVSSKPNGRPIWRIAQEELNRFLRARQSAPAPVVRRLLREKAEETFFRRGRPVMQLQ
jgi:hypothetical protein